MVNSRLPIPIQKYIGLSDIEILDILTEYPFYNFPKVAQILKKSKEGVDNIKELNYFGFEKKKLNEYVDVILHHDIDTLVQNNEELVDFTTSTHNSEDTDEPSLNEVIIQVDPLPNVYLDEPQIHALELNIDNKNLSSDLQNLLDDQAKSESNLIEFIDDSEPPIVLPALNQSAIHIDEIEETPIEFMDTPPVEEIQGSSDTFVTENEQTPTHEEVNAFPEPIFIPYEEKIEENDEISGLSEESKTQEEVSTTAIEFVLSNEKNIPVNMNESVTEQEELTLENAPQEELDFTAWLNNFTSKTPPVFQSALPVTEQKSDPFTTIEEESSESELSQNIDIQTIEHTLSDEIDNIKTSPKSQLAKDDELEVVLRDKFFLKQKEIKTVSRKTPSDFRIQDEARNSITSIEIITETAAMLYVQQNNIPKAIEIYKKLIERFPEKSAFFAVQIEKLTK